MKTINNKKNYILKLEFNILYKLNFNINIKVK